MAESDRKTLKVGIYSFPARCSAFKRVSVKISRQVRLLCPWARHVTGLPLYLWAVGLVVTGGSWLEDRKGYFAVSWPRQHGN